MGEQEHYIITKTAASLRRRVHVPSFYYTRRGLFRNGPLPLYRFLYALLYVLYASLICPGSPSDSFVDSASVKTKKKTTRKLANPAKRAGSWRETVAGRRCDRPFPNPPCSPVPAHKAGLTRPRSPRGKGRPEGEGGLGGAAD